MPRRLRLEYAGAIYHVMSRGNRREVIFRDRKDYETFVGTLAEACGKTGWQVHAWCLMRNHFHLVIETPTANLVVGMKWLLGVYTKRFNIRHKLCGHLFAGRYQALPVDGSGNGYWRTVCDYVHLNPDRAKLVKRGVALESFRWSSYGQYLQAPPRRPPWLRVDRLLGELGMARDSTAGRQEFARRMELRREEAKPEEYEAARRAWGVGSEEFRQELMAAAQGRVGANHYGWEKQESGAQKSERMIRARIKELGWDEPALERRRKGDPEKVKLAGRLRQETTMSLKWIAARLKMGSWTYLSNLLGVERSKTKKS